MLYAIVRPLLGTRVALLSALALAVAPYHVSFANYSRAFMLGSLGLLLALWAAARLAQGGPPRWWALYVTGATIAFWSTYDSWLFMAALTAALLIAGRPPRREVARSRRSPWRCSCPGSTRRCAASTRSTSRRWRPSTRQPTPNGIRDTLVPLFFGEHGAADSRPLRWLQLLALVAAFAWGAAELRRRGRTEFLLLPASRSPRSRCTRSSRSAGPTCSRSATSPC